MWNSQDYRTTVDVGALVGQQLDDSLVLLPSRPRQRRPIAITLGVWINAVLAEQQLDDSLVPVLGRPQQRRPTISGVFRLGIDFASIEHQLHHRLVPVRGRPRQRCPTHIALNWPCRSVNMCASLKPSLRQNLPRWRSARNEVVLRQLVNVLTRLAGELK